MSQNHIIERDAHILDGISKRNVRRHLQKLTKAANILITKGALQQDQIRFLLENNNEAKVRRSANPLILGKAKIMSYEDLEAARAKRNERDAAKIAKLGKRRRKLETALEDANTSEPTARTGDALESAGMPVGQRNEMQGADSEAVPIPWCAPVA